MIIFYPAKKIIKEIQMNYELEQHDSFQSISLDDWKHDVVDGYSIQSYDSDLDQFKEIITPDLQTGEGPEIETANAYWTTTGETPVINDQFVVEDDKRSSGGWSDISPEEDEDYKLRNELEQIEDLPPLNEWNEYKRHTLRQKNIREERFIAIFDWLRKQTNREDLKKHWKNFRTRNRESYQKCKKNHEWSEIFLTANQVEKLEAYFKIRLRILCTLENSKPPTLNGQP
jgi:hypothetical protein